MLSRIRATCPVGRLLALALAGVLACGQGGGDRAGVTTPPSASFKPVLSWVKVSVSPLSVEVGQTATATAEAFDQNGGVYSAPPFSFTSSSPTVAPVDPAGTIKALAPGAVTITAAVGGKEASRDITIIPVVVTRIEVSPTTLALDPGATGNLVVQLFDARGGTIAGRSVSWTSSDTSVAVVNPAGRVTARRSGRAKITASSGDRFASAILTVSGADIPAVDLVVSFARPAPGEIVGDTLEILANASSSSPIALVEAIFDGTRLPLVKVPAGALGGTWLWHGIFFIATVHFGKYYVVVTATDLATATATDSVLFERDPVKKGGGSAGESKKNKLVAPVVLPKPFRGSLRGNP